MSSESQPISISEFATAIKEITNDALQETAKSLRLSVTKLEETIDFLKEEISQGLLDSEMYKDVIEENKEVIQTQNEKISETVKELKNRGLLANEEKKETEEDGVYL